jgi:hypothetical protein
MAMSALSTSPPPHYRCTLGNDMTARRIEGHLAHRVVVNGVFTVSFARVGVFVQALS